MQQPWICRIPYHAIIISGNNAKEFLQGQLSCDISNLDNNNLTLGCYCNYKGRVQASFCLIRDNMQYHLICHQSLTASTAATLKRYGAFSKINIEINQRPIYAAHPMALHIPLPPAQQQCLITEEYICCQYPISDIYLYICATKPKNLENCDANWLRAHIQHKLVHIQKATQNLFTPAMLNYLELKLASVTKGCYLGQEVIMRSAKLGHTKRGLYSFSSQTKVQAGDPVMHDDNTAGIIASATGNNGGSIGLVVLQTRYLDTALNIKIAP